MHTMRTTDLNPALFTRIVPSQYLSFSFPNPLPPPQNPYSETLLVAVADSPSNPTSPETTAALLVPPRREQDWIFSTAAGHFQLLLSFSSAQLPLSRLLLIGNLPSCYSPSQQDDNFIPLDRFKESLIPLLLALCPKSAFLNGKPSPSIPFLCYEDGVMRCNVVEKVVGARNGEMLVEDVEIEVLPALRELRRRLRFKRMPNLVQTEVRLFAESVDCGELRPEMGSLVQPYLGAMVAALFLNGCGVDEAFRRGFVPWVLCVGVGGGALVACLRSGFGFGVLGVEVDEVVLSVARRHFGLVEGEFLKVVVGDGIELMEGYGLEGSKGCLFHAIMVDLDEEDPLNGVGAPPVEFLKRSVVVGARMALHPEGILVVNVICGDELLYARMIELFREFFCELYEVRVDDGGSFVIVATASPIGFDVKRMGKQGGVYEKLKELGCERFIDGIKKI